MMKIVLPGKIQIIGLTWHKAFSPRLHHTLSLNSTRYAMQLKEEWTKHLFEDLNYGRPFFSRYDRRHDLSFVGFYKLTDKWNFNFNFSYATGQPVTIPLYTYPGFAFNYDQSKTTGSDILLYTQGGRNSYRMKDFHRLDIAFQRRLQWKHVRGNIEFGLFNVYNRKNPYYYYADTQSVGDPLNNPQSISVIKSVSLFPIIPSVSLSFEF